MCMTKFALTKKCFLGARSPDPGENTAGAECSLTKGVYFGVATLACYGEAPD